MFGMNLRAQYATSIDQSYNNVESGDAEFQGSLQGVTPKLAEKPTFASLSGRYKAISSRKDKAGSHYDSFKAWVRSVADPTRDDVSKIQSEGQALQMEMAQIDSSIRSLSAELSMLIRTSE
ncbi:MAG: hypothetical protein H6729_05065 [Deltaproteobacteria bacterium]|nr:hypothetical protein [Deltaproteobacteria bacterium]